MIELIDLDLHYVACVKRVILPYAFSLIFVDVFDNPVEDVASAVIPPQHQYLPHQRVRTVFLQTKAVKMKTP